MDWARLLAYITGTVDQELLLRNEYLTAETVLPQSTVGSSIVSRIHGVV
jgi:putative transposase